MADITYDYNATQLQGNQNLVAGKGDAHNLKALTSTIELGSYASGTTVQVARIPSNARISGLSRIYWDDLATSGSPTIDVGLASVNANITSDSTALSNGHAVSSASATGSPLVTDIAFMGDFAWQNVTGQSTDPGGALDVYLSVKDAALNKAGTVTVELFTYFD